MIVRAEARGDLDAIDRVVEAAFGRRDEADLIAALRRSGDAVLSLVAVDGVAADGQSLLSKLSSQGNSLVLGPLAAAPKNAVQPARRVGSVVS